jgi:hypothetical protein
MVMEIMFRVKKKSQIFNCILRITRDPLSLYSKEIIFVFLVNEISLEQRSRMRGSYTFSPLVASMAVAGQLCYFLLILSFYLNQRGMK